MPSESLKTVGDVAVSTHEDVNQMSYVVTFTSLGTPANLGNLPLVQATHLHWATPPRVSVRKISRVLRRRVVVQRPGLALPARA